MSGPVPAEVAVMLEHDSLPCQTSDPELFFSTEREEIDVAIALCARCPVREQCLSLALRNKESCGVWGGHILRKGRVTNRKPASHRPRVAALAAHPDTIAA